MKKINIVYLSLLTLIFSSCTTENRSEINTIAQSPAITQPSAPVKDSLNSLNNKYELKNDSPKVNIASCKLPDKITQLPIFVMAGKKYDFASIKNVFMENKTVKEEPFENEMGDAISYATEEGEKLTIYQGYIRYATPLGSHMRSMFNPKSASISNNKSKELFNLFNTIKETPSLSFKSTKEVIEEGVEFCKNIGIDLNTVKPMVYSLEYAAINTLQDQLIKDEYFLKKFEPRTLTKNESCYYIVFEINQDSTVIDSSGYTNKSTGNLMNGSSVLMIVSNKGIEYFETLGSIYEKKEVLEEDATLTSLQVCFDKFLKKQDDNLLVKSVNVDSIQLAYVPIPKKDSTDIIFQPAWIFYSALEVIVDQKSGETYILRDVMRIDAVTGKEIL